MLWEGISLLVLGSDPNFIDKLVQTSFGLGGPRQLGQRISPSSPSCMQPCYTITPTYQPTPPPPANNNGIGYGEEEGCCVDGLNHQHGQVHGDGHGHGQQCNGGATASTTLTTTFYNCEDGMAYNGC